MTTLPMKPLLPLFAAVVLAGPTRAADPAAVEFFENQVRPVLAENCYGCHGPQKQKGGLRLDSAAAVTKGGESGPVVSPGKPEASRLIKAVRQTDDDLKMPPKGRLKDAEIAALTTWVKSGA